jgi:hypothetical protein
VVISKDKDIHDIVNDHELQVDGISQFLATCYVEEAIATIVIFGAVLLSEVNRVNVRIPIDL